MTNTYTTMMGNVITANETGTHCYMWPNGRKDGRVRIKKAEYEQIIREDKLERELASEAPVEIEVTELEPNEGKMVYHDEPIEYTDIEAAVEATEESQTTEETQQIAKEFAPKKKRTRKSKDIAYDGNGITLTAKQVDFIHHLPNTCFWEHGLDSAVWTDVLADEIGGQFAGKPMTVGAMISTLCEKGLGVRAKGRVNKRNCTSFRLTGLGKVIAAELGLN